MILNIYKPKDWTSFDVVAKVRGILKAEGTKEKVGHAGTLDPLAEGVLVVLTGKDTKKQSELMKLEKEYEAEVAFGIESPTYDLEGPVKVVQPHLNSSDVREKIEAVFPKYLGEIIQQVPPYSAVKVEGKRLYKKARQGDISQEELPRKKVRIYSIRVNNVSEQTLELTGQSVTVPVVSATVVTSSGTYIRSLAHDWGKDLGTGALLTSLTRTRIGEYKIKDAVRVDEPEKVRALLKQEL